MPQHTPGPWFVVPYYSNGCESCPTIRAGTSPISTKIVAECHGAPYLGFEETNPNARLIAASPDLLEACLAMYPLLYHGKSNTDPEVGEAIHKAYYAIAKATGETP